MKNAVETGRIIVETGHIKVETGHIKVETGRIIVETGRIIVETGHALSLHGEGKKTYVRIWQIRYVILQNKICYFIN